MLSALELCMYTEFGLDWLRLARLILERVLKSGYIIGSNLLCRLSAYKK